MAAFSHLPLGTPIPDRPHAVSCSLPTMADVRGYEEKDPAVTSRLSAGYPRFVVHPYSRRLGELLAARHDLTGRTLWLASSERMARELAAHLRASGLPGAAEAATFSAAGVHGTTHPPLPDLASRAKLFLQHIGGFLSSREAEDRLADLGAAPAAVTTPAAPAAPAGRSKPERPNDAGAEIRRHLARAFPRAREEDLLLANSGMNAVYAAFRAVDAVQRPRGRSIWVQLGWLYLDTIAILQKFTAGPGDYAYFPQVLDFDRLERFFSENGDRIAGVVAEVPTNPLIQTPDVERLAALCRCRGVRLIIDPSVASPFSVDCLAQADLVTVSLTKYTGSDGDIIAGLVAVNPAGPDAQALRSFTAAGLEPVYFRDLDRLAGQIGRTGEVLARIEATAPQVAAFLAGHPKVRDVFWALHPASKDNYLRIARGPHSTGGMISFTLRTPMEPFYDRLLLPKGPSFGMATTLICPFLYLAHYSLVTTESGRRELAASGLDPDLLRLCVGAEPAADIIGALAQALEGPTESAEAPQSRKTKVAAMTAPRPA